MVWCLAFSFGPEQREAVRPWGGEGEGARRSVAAAVRRSARLDNRETGKGKGRRRQQGASSASRIAAAVGVTGSLR